MPNPYRFPQSSDVDGSLTASDGDVDQLVNDHLSLVSHIVRGTLAKVPGHVHRDDLTSAGSMALVQAAQSYDPSRGIPFARYAQARIRGAVVDELRGMDWASRSVRRKAREIDEARGRLGTELGRPPAADEIAREVGLSPAEMTANADDVARASVVSIHGFGDTPMDYILPSSGETPEGEMLRRERLAYLADAVSELPERLRVVVQGYFFGEQPMADLAEELGVSESRISQMRAEAVKLLRDALNTHLDPSMPREQVAPGTPAARRREAYYAAVGARSTAAARIAASGAASRAGVRSA